MENERIQRLLVSEYGELARQAVLVESPFAETTREGRGLREVALGLTPTSLLVAADVLKPNAEVRCPPDLDPSIECLELVSIYPLEFIKLSVFRRRRRRTLKARLVDGRAKYYELGGLDRRSRFWSLWCSQVRSLLERKCLGSSLSESTAAASSTCASTSYMVSSGFEYDSTSGRCRKKRRRCRGGGSAHYYGTKNRSWTQKRLYIGPTYEELWDGSYTPVPIKFTDSSIERIKDELKDLSPSRRPQKKSGRNCGGGSQKMCSLHTCNPDEVILERKNDKRYVDDRLLDKPVKGACDCHRHELLDFQPDRSCFSRGDCPSIVLDLEDLDTDSFSALSHKSPSLSNCNSQQRTPNITGVKSIVHKLSRFGFGINENCRFNLCYESHGKKSTPCNVDPFELIESSVALWERNKTNQPKHLRRYGVSTATYFLHGLGPWSVQPGDRDTVQGRRSHSCVSIRRQPADPELRLPVSRRQLAASVSLTDLSGGPMAMTRGRVVLFWTPDYWYRPRAAADAYREVRRHLGGIKTYLTEKEAKARRRKVFTRGRGILKHTESQDTIQEDEEEDQSIGTTAYLRRLLKLEFRVTLWDLDSTTLSQQLTLIDRELFLRIPGRELEILVQQRTSRDAPNLGAWVAFAHRIACLAASETLAATKLEMRARLVARLINAAEKCFRLRNFHSARSIVAGLQSPAIYRLKATWTHLKIHHATRYDTMQKLSKIFRSPRTRRYREAWLEVESSPPSMPYVGDVVARLLGLCDGLMISSSSVTSRTACEMHGKAAVTQNMMTGRHDRERTWSAKFPAEVRVCWTARQRRLAKVACEQWRTQVISNKDRTKKIAHWIAHCQNHAKVYDFPGHSLAWEFLLKTRYREDRENFFESLQVEPLNDLQFD